MVLYLLLSPHNNEKWELLHRINVMRELERLPAHKALLDLFIRQELIFWKQTIGGEYAHVLFNTEPNRAVLEDSLLPNMHVCAIFDKIIACTKINKQASLIDRYSHSIQSKAKNGKNGYMIVWGNIMYE